MSDQQLRSRIEALPNMAIADLKLMWWTLYDTKIPKFNRTFLEQQLAYRLQEIAYGGLSDKATETLHLLRARKSLSQKRMGKKPPSGVLLIKEYRGVEHRVHALSDGFIYDGKKYKTLSAIAFKITGTHWSGPSFFGFKDD